MIILTKIYNIIILIITIIFIIIVIIIITIFIIINIINFIIIIIDRLYTFSINSLIDISLYIWDRCSFTINFLYWCSLRQPILRNQLFCNSITREIAHISQCTICQKDHVVLWNVRHYIKVKKSNN